MKWELVEEHEEHGADNVATYRMRVSSGWLVRVMTYPINYYKHVNNNIETPIVSMSFVPDQEHKWIVR